MNYCRGCRSLAVLLLVLPLAACSQGYSYVPSFGSSAAPPPQTAAAPAPAPAPASPDLAQQVQALQARVQELESRLAEIEGRKTPAASSHRGQVKPASTPQVTRVPAPSTTSYPPASAAASEKSYHEGMKLYQGKQYAPARSQFHQYLKAQPHGSKAPEARYYLADSFYQECKYREAAVEFNKMATQFPKSILAPAALLRQALAYKQQQQNRSYRNTLGKLVKVYPNSPEAHEAQKWLQQEGKVAAPR